MGANRAYVWGILYAFRAFFFIHFLGERLTPDTRLYSEGRAAWSSPALALSGAIAGYTGVCLVGIAGSFALGWIVARNSRGILPPLAVALCPPGWYTIQPSADAAGAAASVWSCTRPWRNYYVGIVAAFHLEAALVILGARFVWRYCSLRLDIAAIGMGALAQWHPTFHFQVRYFLPGIALLASAESLRLFGYLYSSDRSFSECCSGSSHERS